MSQIYKASTGSGPPPPGTVLTLTGNVGGAVSPDSSGNINIVGPVGSGIVFTGTPISNTLTLTIPNAGLIWVIQPVSITAVAGTGYFANGVAGITVTLPTVSVLGDTFKVYNFNGQGFTIAQGAGQSIQVADMITATGAAGSVSTSFIGDSIELVCSIANTKWEMVSFEGNLSVH